MPAEPRDLENNQRRPGLEIRAKRDDERKLNPYMIDYDKLPKI
jgi:hypothetical protein